MRPNESRRQLVAVFVDGRVSVLFILNVIINFVWSSNGVQCTFVTLQVQLAVVVDLINAVYSIFTILVIVYIAYCILNCMRIIGEQIKLQCNRWCVHLLYLRSRTVFGKLVLQAYKFVRTVFSNFQNNFK